MSWLQVRSRAAALLVAGLLVGCSRVSSTGNGRHPWTQPNVLRIGLTTSPASLSPILATDTTEGMLARLVFDPLTASNAQGQTIPILARVVPTISNGGISRDGRTITFHLRHDVRWQDGVPFTSRDVAFTYRAIVNPNNNVGTNYGFTVVDHVLTPDQFTVVFILRHPFAPIIATLFGDSDNPYQILPAHLLEHEKSLNAIAFNSAPLGTGPYIFERWIRGERLEYRANPHYFLGKPQLAHIIVNLLPDENTALNELRTHEIDWLFEPSPHTLPQILRMADIRTTITQLNAYSGMLINLNRPSLQDIRVRRALAAAIDKSAIVRRLTFGTATLADTDLPAWLWAANPLARADRYNPTKARELLRSAGFTVGQDGILTRAGQRLSLQLSYAQGNATAALEAVAVQADLHNVGIEALIHPYTPTLLYAPYAMGGILARGRYDLNLSGWYSGTDPDNSSQFLCSARPPNGSNYTGYCNQEMEQAQADALATYVRPARKAAYAQIEANLARNVPQIFFYHPRNLEAFNPDFQGLAPSPIVESWNAYRWRI